VVAEFQRRNDGSALLMLTVTERNPLARALSGSLDGVLEAHRRVARARAMLREKAKRTGTEQTWKRPRNEWERRPFDSMG